MESNALKITIAGSLAMDDIDSGKEDPGSQDRPDPLVSDYQDGVEASEGVLNNGDMENKESQTRNSWSHLVCSDPTANGAGEPLLSSREQSITSRTPKIYPSIGAFTVQCANCFKWRLIPSMEKYEEIRECILEKPFICEAGREWKPEMSCNDPPDITQDGSRLWAIDKPSIPRTPSGWQRLLRIRGEGGTKFADVYYASPNGKRLRSLVEIQRFLADHPEYVEEGIDISRFSFQIPRPLQENYVRKRAPHLLTNGGGGLGTSGSPQPAKVMPLAWMPPDVDTEMQLGRLGLSESYKDFPFPKVKHSTSQKTSLKRRSDGNLVHGYNEIDVENTFHL